MSKWTVKYHEQEGVVYLMGGNVELIEMGDHADNVALLHQIAAEHNAMAKVLQYRKEVRAIKCDCGQHSPDYDCPNCRFDIVAEQAGVDTLLNELAKAEG